MLVVLFYLYGEIWTTFCDKKTTKWIGNFYKYQIIIGFKWNIQDKKEDKSPA